MPIDFVMACRRSSIPSRSFRAVLSVLFVDIATQTMDEFRFAPGTLTRTDGAGHHVRRYRISTSRHGAGERRDSHRTPRGLHRISRKIGAGLPVGTIFRGRRPIGFTWKNDPAAPIAHRILWLAGMEPGRNLGDDVDTFNRYIYIHGIGDEPGLGRPASIGCIHVAAADLIPLFDRIPLESLVWIREGGPTVR